MRDVKTNKVFVSVYSGAKDAATNEANHAKAFNMLRREGVQFHVVRGRYKGNVEESFMLYTSNAVQHETHLRVGIELAKAFNQDAVLEVANDDAAILHRLGTGYVTDRVGTFREVSREEAVAHKEYTCDPFSARYFIID